MGKGKDSDGFAVEVLEDSITGQQYLAYSPETYQERVAYYRTLAQERPRPGHSLLELPQATTGETLRGQ
jgi:hypothetical protein